MLNNNLQVQTANHQEVLQGPQQGDKMAKVSDSRSRRAPTHSVKSKNLYSTRC